MVRQAKILALPCADRLAKRLTVGLMVLFFYVFPLPCAAQLSGIAPQDLVTKYPEKPWKLKADELSYDRNAEVHIARGNVEITKLDKKLTADYVRFDQQAMRAYAVGNVVFISGRDVLKGSSINIDLENQVGTIFNGSVFLKQNNFHITGEKIEKTGEKTYEVERATITTCDGDNPDWKITGEKVKVLLDGHGTVDHAKFYTRDVPVFYTPYFYYPVNNDRQSGLLIPDFGSSDRKGNNYNQPYFWAISRSQDATFYGNYMSKRGLKAGAEYRYYLSETTKGAIMLDGFDDRKTDETGEPDAEYGFEDKSVQFPRTNTDRWWLRMSHYQEVPWDFGAQLDLDIVSDQDYLREFENGYMGFKDTEKYFRKYFGRQLDDYNDPVRLNRLNFNRIWSTWSLNTELRYFWDSTQENSDEPDETISRLPVIDLQGSKQKLLRTPFLFDLDSSYNYFRSPSGPRGQRLDIHPRIYYPWRFRNYFTFEPSAGARGTVYYLDDIKFNNEAGHESWASRELFDLRLDFFSDIFRVFNLNLTNIQKIRHSVRPRIVYRYIPDVDKPDVPVFDSIERIDKQSLITYSLTNTLTSKLLKGGETRLAERFGETRGQVTPSPGQYEYKDFFRFEIAQSYDFDAKKREFSPILTKLDFFPGHYVSIDADTGWSVYDHEFTEFNMAASIWDKRGDKLFFQYRYDQRTNDQTGRDDKNVQSIFVGAKIKATNRLDVFGDYEYNIEDDQYIRATAGFKYRSQCWGFDFSYSDRPSEEKFEFRIDLSGLGGVGF
jgi:LPS-assembly protein